MSAVHNVKTGVMVRCEKVADTFANHWSLLVCVSGVAARVEVKTTVRASSGICNVVASCWPY